MATNAFDQFDAGNPFDKFDASGADRAQAAASGVNRGALVNLAGLPVATAINVWDLLKAGVGTLGRMDGSLAPQDMPGLTDRKSIVGSPEWIAAKIEEHGGSQVINPNHPEDQASRLLHAGGQGVAAGLAMPQNAPQAVANALTGAAALTSGQVAAEHGAGPAGQILASAVVPAAVSSAASRAQATQAAAEKTAAQRAPFNDAVRETQEAGYVYPPSQTNPTLLNKVVGGIAGKAATEQAASLKNEGVTDSLVRRGLSLPEDSPLTPDVLAKVRRDEAQTAYEPLKQFGTFQATPNYVRSIVGLQNEYLQSTGGLQTLRVPEVESLLKEVARPGFSSQGAVALIRRLRSDSDTNFRGDSNQVNTARVQKGVANAIEDMIGDNLQQSGQADMLERFQAARQRIAKTYTVEDALDATGRVDPRKLASALNAGKPLTGELATVGKAATIAPLSNRIYTQTPPGVSVLDAAIGASGAVPAIATGHAGLAATALWPFGRMAARGVALSGPYQRTFAQPPEVPQPSNLAQLLNPSGAPGMSMLPSAPMSASLQSDASRRRLLAQLLMNQEQR